VEARVNGIQGWHEVVEKRDPSLLGALLADEVVFHSPVVHTPQRGKAITTLYLGAAVKVFGNDTFRYVREVSQGPHSVLEFVTQLGEVQVNGVDMITFDQAGRIIDFKVMIRPLKAIQLIHQLMAAALPKPT
jgi:hypothetical protein